MPGDVASAFGARVDTEPWRKNMSITSPQDLIALKLMHIMDAETEASRCLQEMRGQIKNPQLQQCLDHRLQEGQQVMNGIKGSMGKFGGQSAGNGQNAAARGIMQEARMLMSEIQPEELKEAAAIGSLQSLEHYCIATWGTVKALARQMGDQQVASVMEQALDSGKRFDSELTRIAEQRVNPSAMQQGGKH
jgi:ferritin-like metal-binding protein YciE